MAENESVASQLSKLEQLRGSGALTDDEFQKLKKSLISAEPQMLSPANPAGEARDSHVRRFLPLIIIVAVVTGAFLFPLVFEGAGNECSAFEQVALRQVEAQKGAGQSEQEGFAAGFLGMMQRASNGSFASAAAKHRYPNLPPVMGCTLGYYDLLFGGRFTPDTQNASNNSGETAPPDQPQPAPSQVQTPDQGAPAPSQTTNQTDPSGAPDASSDAVVPKANEAAPPSEGTGPSTNAPAVAPPASASNASLPNIAPSFNCDKASHPAETLVCSDSELASLDRQLADLYRRAGEQAADTREIVLDQRAWLAARNACTSKSCLLRLYASRKNDLARWVDP